MALDINKWLVEDLGFSADEAKELAPKFTEQRVRAIETGYLRQSDYSRQMNDLKKAQDDLAAANERVNAEMAEFATIQANEGQITKKMREDLDRAQQSALRMQQKVRDLAIAAGQDPAKALEGLETTVPTPPPSTTAQQPDLTGYVKSDDLQSILGGIVDYQVRLPAVLLRLGREHRALTGQELDEQRLIQELSERSSHNAKHARNPSAQKSLDVVKIWEDLYEVPRLRDEAQAKKQKELEDAAFARGREAALTEASVPGSHTPEGRHAPVFTRERKSALERPQPGSTTSAAVQAFRTGKYRQQGPGAGSGSNSGSGRSA